MEWFPWLVLGHLLGDYVFQNSWMALNKKDDISICILHCAIYTILVCLSICLFGNVPFSITLLFGIFLSHIVLDGTRLVDKWISFYGQDSFTSCVHHRRNFENKRIVDWECELNAGEIVRTSFGTFIYIAIDNTLHFFMMMLFIKYMII